MRTTDGGNITCMYTVDIYIEMILTVYLVGSIESGPLCCVYRALFRSGLIRSIVYPEPKSELLRVGHLTYGCNLGWVRVGLVRVVGVTWVFIFKPGWKLGWF